MDRWSTEESALAKRIAAARDHVDTVALPERELLRITGACASLGVDGVRGDIVTARAARALAALDGAGEVCEQHVRRAAALALAHRRRRDPLDGGAPGDDELQRALDMPDDQPPPPTAATPPQAPPAVDHRRAQGSPPPDRAGAAGRDGANRRPGPA